MLLRKIIKNLLYFLVKSVFKTHFSCLFSAHLEQRYYTIKLSELYDTLSLTNCTVLTADTIMWCPKPLLFLMIFLYHIKKLQSFRCFYCATFVQLNHLHTHTHTHTKNIYQIYTYVISLLLLP
jgi:hypothetical protein